MSNFRLALPPLLQILLILVLVADILIIKKYIFYTESCVNYFTLINLIQVHACTLSLKLSQLCTQKGTFSNIVRGIGGRGVK